MIERFLEAQDQPDDRDEMTVYNRANVELWQGKKQTHWMWYIFPQPEGLGQSEMSRYYGLRPGEIEEYKAHPVLWGRLLASVVLALRAADGRTLEDVFGPVDAMKFRSCLEAFDLAMPEAVRCST